MDPLQISVKELNLFVIGCKMRVGFFVDYP